MDSPLEVFSDLSERVHYSDPNFPLYVRRDVLRRYGYSAVCHWHPDLEFILILDGSMDYFVNGSFVHIAAHHGIFVNSRRLHYGFSAHRTDCTFVAVVVHPTLLAEGSPTARAYLKQRFGPDTDDYLLLSPDIPWQREDLQLIARICDEADSKAANPLRFLSQAAILCADAGDHIQQRPGHLVDDPLKTIAISMTDFIHRHYERKITLDDIAASGAVCRSRCCRLFNTYVGQAPNAYLTGYRITRSCEMLRETDRTICEIALTCGFQSASYFSHVFRKEIGLTPQQYRQEIAASWLTPSTAT